MNIYQQFIAKSKYARYLDDKKRREHWPETVDRYFDYFDKKAEADVPKDVVDELKAAVLNLDVMPSMRLLMTAGKAHEKSHVASFNCAFVPIDDIKAFDETMYILMCLHPDTLVKTVSGPKKISELTTQDLVSSFNKNTREFEWKKVLNVIETPSSNLEKFKITFQNDTEVICTYNHKFLTTNRGWVEAKDLEVEDDLVSPTYEIYKITNSINNKIYIGQTSVGLELRYKQHLSPPKRLNTPLAKAVRKYGYSCWTVEVLDFAYTETEALAKENKYIKEFNSIATGYNCIEAIKGTKGLKWTDEQRKKASENAYPRTESHRLAASLRLKELNKGKILETRKSQEYKEMCRINNLGEKNPRYGKKDSEERRQQKREHSKQRQRDSKGRFV